MNLYDYQLRAVETAMPTAFSYDYLIPAIVGEVGEMFGHRAKAIRDKWAPGTLEPELVGEYGDVAWMVAVLLYWKAVEEPSPKACQLVYELESSDPWQDVLGWAHDLFVEYSDNTDRLDDERLVDAAMRLWACLVVNCEAITGQTVDTVLAYNVAKLADRKARKVLAGSGDHR